MLSLIYQNTTQKDGRNEIYQRTKRKAKILIDPNVLINEN